MRNCATWKNIEKKKKYVSDFSIDDMETKKNPRSVVIKILNNSQNTTIFIQKASRSTTLLKRDSSTGVFLWNLKKI